jgi:O-antigen/teichoic acid export membrane protein
MRDPAETTMTGDDPLKRDTTVLLASRAFNHLCGLVSHMIVARTLAIGFIGVYNFSLSVAQSLLVVSAVDANWLLSRQVARHPEQKDLALSRLLAFRGLLAPVFFVAIAIAGYLSPRGVWAVVVAVAAMKWLETLGGTFYAYLFGLRKIVQQAAIASSSQALFLLLLAAAMTSFPDIRSLVGAHAVRAALAAGGCLLVVYGLGRTRPRLAWPRELVRPTLPLAAIGFLGLATRQIDTLVIGWLLSYGDVGRYRLAMTVINAGGIVPSSFGQSAYARLAADQTTSKPLLRRLLLALLLLGGSAAALAYLLAWPICGLLFGPVGAEVAPVLRVAVPLIVIGFVADFLSIAFRALAREKTLLRLRLASFVAALALTCALVPAFGVPGAIWARIGSGALQIALFWRSIATSPEAPAKKG